MLDKTNQQILQCLQGDSRMQLREIGKIVHLTGQAVAIRIRNMQEEGIIEAFTVTLNPRKLGRPIYAFITVFMKASTDHVSFLHFLLEKDEIVEAYRITGDGCYWLKANLSNQDELNTLLDAILLYGNYKVSTAINKMK
jgi:Lrp/AsnC family leucine-responsive transcriptional regulator